MGDYKEFSAKTKSEAITKACMDLGVSSDQLEIQTVSEGSSGFFGFGSKPAVIRVRPLAVDSMDEEIREIVETVSSEKLREEEIQKKQPSVKKTKASKGGRGKKQDNKAEQAIAANPDDNDEIISSPAPMVKEPEPIEEKPTMTQEEFSIPEPVQKVEDGSEEAAESNQKSRRSRDRRERSRNRKREKISDTESKENNNRPGRKNPRSETPQPETQEQPPVEETEQKPVRVSKPIKIITDPDEIADIEMRAIVFLRDVFASMDLGDVEITSKYNTEDGSLDVDFEGEDMGMLIGKRGQTLDSLQYLTSLVVNKGKEDYIRVKLDTEDYRSRRKETLENLARGIAYKVRKTRRPVVLEPMNPYERRIIHASLQGNRYVETMSEGEEPYRHIVVRLKRY